MSGGRGGGTGGGKGGGLGGIGGLGYGGGLGKFGVVVGGGGGDGGNLSQHSMLKHGQKSPSSGKHVTNGQSIGSVSK